MRKKLSTKQIENMFNVLRTLLALLISALVAVLLMSLASDNLGKDFVTFLLGPLRSKSSLISIINKAIPLIFTGVAVTMVNQSGRVNIAAEGAFFAGAVGATIAAARSGVPSWLHLIFALVLAAIFGAVIMGIPAILDVKYNVITIVSSLMMNYVSLYGGLYIILNILLDPSAGFEASLPFAEASKIPKIGTTRVHYGVFIAVIVVILASVYLYRTSDGYAIRTVGKNELFAKLSGINNKKTIVKTALISGCIAGLGGGVEVLGNYDRFVYSGFTNHGWDGIMLAVLCRNNPKFIPLGALFLAYIQTSSDALNLTSNMPPEIIDIIQSIIIVFVAAKGLLSRQEHKAIVANAQRDVEQEDLNA